ncbi:MAG TPA: hypothetical protein DCR40_04725 [Prolixibacteraceae bacterium]|nr:hypothetical protein [Prolixibacteraceae bacterium]
MESNEIIRNQIFEIIRNQLKANNPPETKLTLERLKGLGYNKLDSKKLIGQCLAVELFHIFKHGEPFNALRYITNLKKLPEAPFDD